MKGILSVTLVSFLIINTISVDAFLFGSSPKDFCHPNPCKHDGECLLDSKNSMKGSCTCKGHYFGLTCEEKDACYSNPCKHSGTCQVDARNPKLAICNCTSEYYGQTCEQKSACYGNPCKHSGTCVLDPKNLKGPATCICAVEYHGQTCEQKSGCYSNPCKHKGVCVLDSKNPAKQGSCNCTNEYYGAVCEKETGCHKGLFSSPCKHDAVCVVDPKNPEKPGSCVCKSGYYGAKCENKDGCFNKPCKFGSCIVDSKHPEKYSCKCPIGQVGDKCDKADECSKNPCQNGGTCQLDAKLHAACSCTNGWSDKHCEKRNCTITEFKGKHFAKLPKIYIDEAVVSKFEKFEEIAKKCKVNVQQSRSFSVQPTMLVLLNDAPHYIGRALTFELQDENGKLLCNSICLSKPTIQMAAAKCFVDGVIAEGWKYNSALQQIHDNTYVANPMLFKTLREHIQVGCKDKNF